MARTLVWDGDLELSGAISHLGLVAPVLNYDATCGDGVVAADAAITAAQAAGPVVFSKGTYRVAANLDITQPLTITDGAVIKPAAGVTVTVYGGCSAPNARWIDTSLGGSVVFKSSAGVKLNPRWWGAKGDFNPETGVATTDDTAAFQAMAAAGAGSVWRGPTFFIPAGSYYVTGSIAFTAHYTTVETAGAHATQFCFNPAADDTPLFIFGSAAQETFIASLRGGVGILGYSGNTRAKVAIDIRDVSEFRGEEIYVHNSFISTGRQTTNPSVGVRFQGREAIYLKNCSIATDRPIHLKNNLRDATPYDNASATKYDVDTVELHNVYLLAQASNGSSIYADSGVYVHNFTVTGRQVWTGGSHGFYFVNAALQTLPCRSVVLDGIRFEVTTGVAPMYFANIEMSTNSGGGAEPMISFAMRNCQTATTQKLRLRKVHFVSLEDSTIEGLDIDDCDVVAGRNCRFPLGATLSWGSLGKVYSAGEKVTMAHEPDFLYSASYSIAKLSAQKLAATALPTSSAGLASGDLWRDAAAGNVVKCVP